MFIFKKTKDPSNEYDIADVVFEVNTISLAELVQQFEAFLKANEFYFDGHLDFVEELEGHELDELSRIQLENISLTEALARRDEEIAFLRKQFEAK